MPAIITTVGTSLLANFLRDPGSGAPLEPCRTKSSVSADDLKNYLRTTPPSDASAETNGLTKLMAGARDSLYFLSSDTDDGKKCAEALSSWYTEAGYSSRVLIIEGLHNDIESFKIKGLYNLIQTVADLIEQHMGDAVINATGGYKAEIAYATLLGILFHVDVYYIHEEFRDIIELPVLPISFNFIEFDFCREHIKSVIDAESVETAERLYAELPDELHALLMKDPYSGRYCYSPLGIACSRSCAFHLERKKLQAQI